MKYMIQGKKSNINMKQWMKNRKEGKKKERKEGREERRVDRLMKVNAIANVEIIFINKSQYLSLNKTHRKSEIGYSLSMFKDSISGD